MPIKLIKKVEFPSTIFVFAIFGIYSFSLAPVLTDFLQYGKTNYFVGIFGFLIYFLEPFAFDFKLYMIRLRAEARKMEIQKAEGEKHIVPRAGPMIWVGLFFRIVFRVGIAAISISALGFPIFGIGNDTTGTGFFTTIGSFVLEGVLFFYACTRTNLFNQVPSTREEFNLESNNDTAWAERELQKADTRNVFMKELLADILLHIYAFILYTAWWDCVNKEGIKMVHRNFEAGTGVILGFIAPMPMLFSMTLLAMMPLRLAYWIENAAMVFSSKERRRTRIAFFVAALITISPVIAELFRLYFPK